MSEEYEKIESKDEGREENIKLWRSVEKTPTSQTKAGKLNGQNITSVKPHFQRMKATELFGPCGKGWGVIPESEQFTRHQIGDTHLLCYKATFFYVLNGDKFEFPICATEKEAYITNGGKGYMKIDDSADKKVATNALTKGLSFLGFSADIFHGLHDDASYIMKMKSEEDAQAELDAVDEKHEYKKWRMKIQGEILTAKDLDGLEKLYVESLRKASSASDPELINKLQDLKNQRIKELRKDKK